MKSLTIKSLAVELVVLLFLAVGSYGQMNQSEILDGRLKSTLDVTYLSSYIFRGFDVYPGSHGEGAVQSSIDLDVYQTGLGLKVLMSRANTSGYENSEWLNYSLYYKNIFKQDQTCETNYELVYGYHQFPDMPSHAKNMQEIYTKFSWPRLCPSGIVPQYTIIRAWQAESNATLANDAGGWIHVLGLSYDWIISGMLYDVPEHTIHTFTEVTYNGNTWGVLNTPAGATSSTDVDHDWSHVLFGVSTDFEITEDLVFTPVLYYQLSMDDSVNDSDETWASLSVAYKF